MSYFKINNTDYSVCVNALTVNKSNLYNAQTNAAGSSVVDYIGSKRTIDVGIIPLDDETMKSLKADIDAFNVSLSFMNPSTGELEEGVECIIPSDSVSYYTIQADNVLFKAFTLKFTEL